MIWYFIKLLNWVIWSLITNRRSEGFLYKTHLLYISWKAQYHINYWDNFGIISICSACIHDHIQQSKMLRSMYSTQRETFCKFQSWSPHVGAVYEIKLWLTAGDRLGGKGRPPSDLLLERIKPLRRKRRTWSGSQGEKTPLKPHIRED